MIKLKDLLRESIEEEIIELRKVVKNLNDQADSRYRQVASSGTEHHHPSNPFQPHMFNQNSQEEGHRQALQDPEYKKLKYIAMRMEFKLRQLEKSYKKSKK